MSIVGETLACRQKSRNVQDRYAVAVVKEPTRRQKQIPVVPPRLQGICHGKYIAYVLFLRRGGLAVPQGIVHVF